jgi:antitoxin YefM
VEGDKQLPDLPMRGKRQSGLTSSNVADEIDSTTSISGTITRTTMKEPPMAVTASEARKNLFPLIEKVNDDRTPIEITSRRGDAVLLSRADYDALEETAHLLRVPANAKRLIESLQQARTGQREEHDLTR